MAVTVPFRQLQPFGVEVDRDLSAPFAPSEAYHFVELFRRHAFILARGQALTDEREDELRRLLGGHMGMERVVRPQQLSFAAESGHLLELTLDKGDWLAWDSRTLNRR